MVTRVGTWWGTNPSKHEETDIDVVGLDKHKKKAVIGECKFRNEKIDKTIFDSLLERKDLLHENFLDCHKLSLATIKTITTNYNVNS